MSAPEAVPLLEALTPLVTQPPTVSTRPRHSLPKRLGFLEFAWSLSREPSVEGSEGGRHQREMAFANVMGLWDLLGSEVASSPMTLPSEP